MTATGYQNYFGGYSSYGQNQAGSYLMNLQSQLHQGVIPSLDSLMDDYPFESESPESQALQARTLALLQQAGPLGQQRAKQLALRVSNQHFDNINGSLSSILQNLDPESPEAQQIQARIAAVQSIENQTSNLLAKSLDEDPSHGGDIHLNQENQGSDGNIFSMMSQMVQQMLSMFSNAYGRAAV